MFTKFGPEVQNTSIKIPIVLGERLTFTFKFNLKSNFHYAQFHHWSELQPIE